MSPARPSESTTKLPVTPLAIRQLRSVARQTRLINGIFAALNSSIMIDDLMLMLLTILTTPRGLGFTRAHIFEVGGNPRQCTGKLGLGCESAEELRQLKRDIEKEENLLASMALKRTDEQNNAMREGLDDLRDQTWWITAFQRAEADNPITAHIEGIDLYRSTLRATPPLLASQSDIFAQHIHTATDAKRLRAETVKMLGGDFLIAPLRTKQGVRAIVAVDKTHQSANITTDDQANLEWLCNQASLALENAELYENLQRAYHEIEEVDRIKSNFLSTISHELRTPLTSILGFAQIILTGRVGEVNPEVSRLLDKVVDKTRDLHAMVNDLLEITEIQAGGLVHLSHQPVRVESVTGEIIERILQRRQAGSCTINHNIPKEKLPTVLGDAKGVERIIYHLIDNAVKFLPDGGEVTIDYKVTGDRLNVLIRDNGIGIAPEHLQNIFDHFYQVDSDLNRSYSGVGLGLTIAKRLADLLDATIGVTSKLGSGSTFRVGFPITTGATT